MAKVTINIDNHEQPYTVSQMRKRLAQVLSKLNGDQLVSFSFSAHFGSYQAAAPATHGDIYDEYADGSRHSGLYPPMMFGELARPEND
jgi:hypothetical protein